MENKDIFRRERFEIFLPHDENPDNLVEAWKEKFTVKEVEEGKGKRTLILERVGEDK